MPPGSFYVGVQIRGTLVSGRSGTGALWWWHGIFTRTQGPDVRQGASRSTFPPDGNLQACIPVQPVNTLNPGASLKPHAIWGSMGRPAALSFDNYMCTYLHYELRTKAKKIAADSEKQKKVGW